MRVLLVSDIHSNWPALQAVREPYDVCLFMGDLVDYGLEPSPCIDWVRRNATHSVRGNHDHGAAQGVVISGAAGFRYLTAVTRPITSEKLSEPDRRFLASFPLTKYVTLNGRRYLLVHASPRDPMDEFAPPDVDFWLRRLEGVDVDFVICGHTHQPYILQVGKTTVINPGSIGLPRDGDPRASYGVVTDNVIELRRVEYAVEEMVDSIRISPLADRAKEMLTEVYRTGRLLNGKNGNGKDFSDSKPRLGLYSAPPPEWDENAEDMDTRVQ
jgi:putative phosphoesterase